MHIEWAVAAQKVLSKAAEYLLPVHSKGTDHSCTSAHSDWRANAGLSPDCGEGEEGEEGEG